MKNKILVVVSALALSVASVGVMSNMNQAYADETMDCCGTKVYGNSCPDELNHCKSTQDTILGIVRNVVTALSTIVGVISVCVIVYAGIMYMTAMGDPGKIATAKTAIIAAVIGLVISVVAFAIVRFVTGALAG